MGCPFWNADLGWVDLGSHSGVQIWVDLGRFSLCGAHLGWFDLGRFSLCGADLGWFDLGRFSFWGAELGWVDLGRFSFWGADLGRSGEVLILGCRSGVYTAVVFLQVRLPEIVVCGLEVYISVVRCFCGAFFVPENFQRACLHQARVKHGGGGAGSPAHMR